jgi:hypothetical protein
MMRYDESPDKYIGLLLLIPIIDWKYAINESRSFSVRNESANTFSENYATRIITNLLYTSSLTVQFIERHSKNWSAKSTLKVMNLEFKIAPAVHTKCWILMLRYITNESTLSAIYSTLSAIYSTSV